MARTLTSFVNSSPTALVTAVNTYLATLTNPIIRQVQVNLIQQQARAGLEYCCTVEFDTGGAAIGTPWLLAINQNKALSSLVTTEQAFLAANPTYFIAGGRLLFIDTIFQFPLYSMWRVYNTTAGASANYLPL